MNRDPDELPSGWIWTKLEEICTKPQYGWTTKADHKGSGLKLLRTSDISSDEIDWDGVPYCSKLPYNENKYLLRKGDIVVSRAGSVGISKEIEDCPKTVFASYLIRFRPLKPIQSKFVSLFLKSPSYWLAIAKNISGITIPNVNATKLKQIRIPLPPLAEQNRIIGKLESLLSESKTVKHAIDKIPPLLKSFRQSVLAKAFRGGLTKRGPNDEPAEKLLARIKQERKKGKQIHTMEKETQPPTGSPELPKGWLWAKLGEISHVVKEQIEPVEKPEKAFNYLSIGNIESDTGNLVNFSPTLGKNIRSAKLAFTTQDVLYSKLRPYLNKVHIPIFSGISSTDLIPIRPEGGIPREYIAHFLRTQKVVRYADQRVRGVQLPRLPVGGLLVLPVPIAPLEEQKRIIARIEELFSFADLVEVAVKRAREQVDKIDQTILVKAFRGELVPQDPNDEPASTLLQRIKVDTAKMQIKARKKKRKIRSPSEVQQTLAKPSRSIRAFLKEMGQATVEQVYQASGLSMSDFWDKLKKEIDAGRIEQIRKGNLVFLKVKS